MIDIVKEYASKRLELLKMEATEKGSMTVGNVIFIVLLIFFFLYFFILLNLGLGLLIGYYLDNYAWGVLIMAGFYLLLMIILFVAKKSLKNSVANKIIKSLNK